MRSHDRPILVTGAAGFAGSHLLDLVSADGTPIVAWLRPNSPLPPGGPSATWERVDLLDRQAVVAAIRRWPPRAVYHCAGAAHVGRAWNDTASALAVNVRGTHNLLEALRQSSLAVPMLVPSSALVYQPRHAPLTENQPLLPSGPYGLSKLAQEMLAARACVDGVAARIARAFNHIGPRQDPSFSASGFARQIAEIENGRREPEILVGNLDARRDLTDVRDTVRGYKAVLERGQDGRAYNICSGRAVTIEEVLHRLIGRARVPVRVRVDEVRLRPNDLPVVVGDPSRVRDELGWTATIPLEQTLDDLLDYWRAELAEHAQRR